MDMIMPRIFHLVIMQSNHTVIKHNFLAYMAAKQSYHMIMYFQ